MALPFNVLLARAHTSATTKASCVVGSERLKRYYRYAGHERIGNQSHGTIYSMVVILRAISKAEPPIGESLHFHLLRHHTSPYASAVGIHNSGVSGMHLQRHSGEYSDWPISGFGPMERSWRLAVFLCNIVKSVVSVAVNAVRRAGLFRHVPVTSYPSRSRSRKREYINDS